MWKDRKAGGCAISIETQAYCNHTCSQCPRNTDPTHSRWTAHGIPIMTRMPTTMVKDLINQAVDMGWNGPIHFSHYSEPLWDKRFVEFAEYSAVRGLIPELFTNGSLLTDELIERIDGLVPYVVISYNTLGSRGHWQSKFKKSKVRVSKSFQILIWSPSTNLLRNAVSRVRGKPCVEPLFSAFRINYDGQMSMCYADFNNEFDLLNAHDHSLEELWFGKEHVRAVKEMAKSGSREKRGLCQICPEVFPNRGTYVKVRK